MGNEKYCKKELLIFLTSMLVKTLSASKIIAEGRSSHHLSYYFFLYTHDLESLIDLLF